MPAKKKSLVPLFTVAFIVAIVSTGIFYGLFVGKLNSAPTQVRATGKVLVAAKAIPAGAPLHPSDVREAPWALPALPAGAISQSKDVENLFAAEPIAADELILKSKLASKGGGTVDSASLGIPAGMRAVSLQVEDSAGVVSLLKPGHRIDIQVIGQAPGAVQPQIRTLLENIQVLTIGKDPLGRGGSQIITVIATPRDCSSLALADSTAKVRITLRNPVDNQATGGANPISSLVQGVSSGSRPSAPPLQRSPEVRLQIRLATLSSKAAEEISTRLYSSSPGALAVISAISSDFDAAVERLQRERALDVLSNSEILVNHRARSGAQWSPDPVSGGGVRVHFEPLSLTAGKVRLRVDPEVIGPAAGEVQKRQPPAEIEVRNGQSFVIKGLSGSADLASLIQKLLPGRQNSGEVMVIITPRFQNPQLASAAPTV